MNTKKGYIYLRDHPSYKIYNVIKIGKATNILERDTTYATGELIRGTFIEIFEIPLNVIGIVENTIKYEFRDYNIRYNAGTEFFNNIIIDLIEPFLQSLNVMYKRLTKEEINNLERSIRVKDSFTKINVKSMVKYLKTNAKNHYTWNEREYQTEIINYCKNELLLQSKVYIELPTGGGKSYIVYNILEYLKSDFIIIVSPRKIVNIQNISKKYLQILKDDYEIFNYSVDNDFNKYLKSLLKRNTKGITICCTQSISKIYETLMLSSIKNITVWFDEAHWGIEDWTHSLDDECVRFWLLNDDAIKYRIFTSATPNKDIVLQNENVFGKLYSPIKVKDLIKLNWLSTLLPIVYSENVENVNNITNLLNDFYEYKRKYGFSYHNKQKNAFNLFYKHYILYKDKKTYIKPFLLVSDNFTIEREPLLKDIVLEYNYKDIKTFEKSINSIGYVVAKYNIGYDFNKLDFIFFCDPKLSIQDIKQSIGRGIRPDGIGVNGKNKYKNLIVSLPVYINPEVNNEINNENNYNQIIETMTYLLYDVGLNYDDIIFKNRYNKTNETNQTNDEIQTSNVNINDYDGENDVKTMIFNLLEYQQRKIASSITYNKAKSIIASKNIKSKEEYYKLCDEDIRLHREPDLIFKRTFVNWIDYLSIKRDYYDFETFKNKINEYLLIYPELKKKYLDLKDICIELCELDPLFPPNDLWVEYYNVKRIQDIIIITNKKKSKGVGGV